jgi:hypothetical protein
VIGAAPQQLGTVSEAKLDDRPIVKQNEAPLCISMIFVVIMGNLGS